MQPLGQEYRRLGKPLGQDAHGQRLDGFLAKNFPFRSRKEWKRLGEDGWLFCNGRRVWPTHKVRAGDELSVFHPLDAEPEADTNLTLIYESAGVMAVLKPGNLPMHESGYYRRNTVMSVLAERFGSEWAPVHRLDRETSGVLLCAATAELRQKLADDFSKRWVDKRYLAFVRGNPDWQTTTVHQPIYLPEESERPRYVIDPRGQEAITEFQVVKMGVDHACLSAKPLTGRSNQIRVHAAWLGHALIGDKVYGPDPSVYEAYHRLGDVEEVHRLAGYSRQALHAAELIFRHPVDGKKTHVVADLPADLKALWDGL